MTDVLRCSVEGTRIVTRLVPRGDVPFTAAEAAVWREIQPRRGARHAISILDLRVRIAAIDGVSFSDREIKEAVAGLVTRHNLAVGSSRQKPAGYFLIADADEMDAACRPLERQAVAMFRRVRALRGRGDRRLRELAGQLLLESES